MLHIFKGELFIYYFFFTLYKHTNQDHKSQPSFAVQTNTNLWISMVRVQALLLHTFNDTLPLFYYFYIYINIRIGRHKSKLSFAV